MTITEATATSLLLKAATRQPLGFEKDPDPATLADALRLLDEKASKALQVSRIVPDADLEAAGRELAQRWADSLAGAL